MSTAYAESFASFIAVLVWCLSGQDAISQKHWLEPVRCINFASLDMCTLI